MTKTLSEAQRERIDALTDADGRLTPEQVVADAKDPTSPLHDLFEWDDKDAARAYRLNEARAVIAAYGYSAAGGEMGNGHAYVRDPERPGAEAGYRRVSALRSDHTASVEATVSALQTAAGHLRRAKDLADALGLEAEFDGLLASVVGVMRSVEAKAA